MPITLSTSLRYALSTLAALLAVLNQTTFAAGHAWSAYISVALVFLASLGVSPVAGAAFQDLLAKFIPTKWLTTVHALTAAGVAAATLALTVNHWSTAAHAIVAGALTILVALGFGPAPTAPPTGPVTAVGGSKLGLP